MTEQPTTSPLSNSTSSKISRFVKRLLLTVFIAIFVIIGGGITLGYLYQNQVKEYIVGELNKQLNTVIIVNGEDIDFTVLKNFPLASLNFKNIKALDALPYKGKDTLFKAGEISLLFNITDIFNKNYRIKKIRIQQATLNIKINQQGHDNYHFWKTSQSTEPSNFSFALNKIVLNQIDIHYKNSQTRHKALFTIKNSEFSGNFSDEKYTMNILSDVYVKQIIADNISFSKNKNLHFEMNFDVDNITNTYTISKGYFNVENVKLQAAGYFISDETTAVNMNIKGKELDIQSFLSLLPEAYKQKINNYTSTGDFYFNAHIDGIFSKNQIPVLTADFGINNAQITEKTSNITLQQVNLKGNFSSGKQFNPAEYVLNIKNFNAVLNGGEIKGELAISDFNNTFIKSVVNASIPLNELQNFMKFDTIETLSGHLKTNININGKWDDVRAMSSQKIALTGHMDVSEMNLKIKNRTLPFTNVNGSFDFNNSDFIVHTLSGKAAQSDFSMSGTFKNVIGYLFNSHEKITLQAQLNSNRINLNELLENSDESSASASEYKLHFSDNINLDLNSNIQHLIFRKFEATAIKGIIKMQNQKLLVDSLLFSSMGGKTAITGIIDGTDSASLHVNCIAELKNINITNMFLSFENFGQQYVTDKNIKGLATAVIKFTTPLSSNLDIDLKKMYAYIEMSIEKGELNNVESMKDLSKYIELNELMNLKFATLKNNIEIKNQLISMPKMEIKSNALTMTASGTHSFNNDINYKITLTLGELLAKKFNKKKKQSAEFQEEENQSIKDKKLFLSMTGTVDNPIIKWDTKESVENFKQNVKAEKQNVKSILKEELGVFKKDTTLKNNQAKEETKKFEIEWEETTTPKEEKKTIKPPKKKTEDEDF